MNKTQRLLILICSMYTALALSLSHGFPPVNSDEVVRSVMGQHRIHGEPVRYSLYDDIFARPVYLLRDVIPDVSLATYHAWLGAWSAINPSSYMSSRLSSVMAGILAILIFYLLGTHLGGHSVGLWSALLVGFNPLFLTASCLARPETLLLATSTTVLWLTFKIPERIALKYFWIGALAMLQISIHPNAVVIAIGLMVFILSGVGREKILSTGLLFVFGGMTGLITASLLVDAQRLWLGMQTVHAYLLRPPILSWPWRPLNWLFQTLRVMWNGETFYFNDALAPGWPLCLRSWWIAMGLLSMLAGLGSDYSHRRPNIRRWLMACTGILISSMALVKAKECLYAINFFPFFIPVAAMGLAKPKKNPQRICAFFGCVLAGTSLFLFLNFCRIYSNHIKPYEQIVRELKAMIPSGSLKVAGPSVLWFDWKKEDFRDSGALLVSHWYMGGTPDLTTWFGGWQPDILILDEAMQNIMRHSESSSNDLKPYLNCPTDLLGYLDTQGAYGRWSVYRLHWK